MPLPDRPDAIRTGTAAAAAGGAAKAPIAKSQDALRTIGELAAETGIATHVLRYWERSVPALRPLRRSGGRRYYRPEDAVLIRRLHHLVTVDGYTLEGAARAVRTHESAVAEPPPPAPLPAAPLRPPPSLDAAPGGAVSLAALRALRDRLQAALDA